MPLVRYRVHSNSIKKDKLGYNNHRIATYDLILDRYPDLPSVIKSKLYYKIGMSYAKAGDKGEAYRNFLMSFDQNRTNLKTFIRIVSLPFISQRIS